VIAWTIAGSDSGGGAGIQADLRTFEGLGVHGCSVIVALTAQNTLGVRAASHVDPAMIRAQIQALREDLPARAIKTGMLGSAEIMSLVADALEELDVPFVCDPVMVATSGDRLMDPEAEAVILERLLPRADLLTPNLPEAEALIGAPIRTPSETEAAGAKLCGLGARSVLIKGGHRDDGPGGAIASDYWTDGARGSWLHGPRVEGNNTHGTGCTLSAAVTASLAAGLPLEDALVVAKAYVTAGLRRGRQVGSGHGPVHQGAFPDEAGDMPWLSETMWGAKRGPAFPETGPRPIGLYPLLDRAARIEALVGTGVTTVQLRIKDLTGGALIEEIRRAVAIAQAHDLRLFVNDHWREAIEAGAYGVHLGQEDLAGADLDAMRAAGLRLGISTHGYAELARAKAARPSYIAFGPIFATKTKQVATSPRGLDMLRRVAGTVDRPLVAIGGIDRIRASSVIEAGAEGLAVMGALAGENQAAVARAWAETLTSRPFTGTRKGPIR